MKRRISRRADMDIDSIYNRIATDNPEAADRFDERIHEAIKLLAKVPGLGHTRDDVQDKRYLFWVVGSYVIAFRIEKKELVVVRVVHGARDFGRLFKPRG